MIKGPLGVEYVIINTSEISDIYQKLMGVNPNVCTYKVGTAIVTNQQEADAIRDTLATKTCIFINDAVTTLFGLSRLHYVWHEDPFRYVVVPSEPTHEAIRFWRSIGRDISS